MIKKFLQRIERKLGPKATAKTMMVQATLENSLLNGGLSTKVGECSWGIARPVWFGDLYLTSCAPETPHLITSITAKNLDVTSELRGTYGVYELIGEN